MLRPEWAVMGTWKAATLKKMQMMEAQLVSKRSKDYQSQLCDIFGLRICGSKVFAETSKSSGKCFFRTQRQAIIQRQQRLQLRLMLPAEFRNIRVLWVVLASKET